MFEVPVGFSTQSTPAGSYLKGTGVWRPFWFENKNNSKQVKITAEWSEKQTYQTVGIFVAIEDFPVENDSFAGRHTYILKANDSNAGIIKADTWNFGNVAKIQIHQCDENGTGEIAGLIRCNPIFTNEMDTSILQLKLQEINEFGSWVEIDSLDYKFIPNANEEEQDISYLLQQIKKWMDCQ